MYLLRILHRLMWKREIPSACISYDDYGSIEIRISGWWMDFRGYGPFSNILCMDAASFWITVTVTACWRPVSARVRPWIEPDPESGFMHSTAISRSGKGSLHRSQPAARSLQLRLLRNWRIEVPRSRRLRPIAGFGTELNPARCRLRLPLVLSIGTLLLEGIHWRCGAGRHPVFIINIICWHYYVVVTNDFLVPFWTLGPPAVPPTSLLDPLELTEWVRGSPEPEPEPVQATEHCPTC